jgi:hypothetical protein
LKDTVSAKQAYEMTVQNLKNTIKSVCKEDAESIINKIFHDNAEELFFNKERTKATTENIIKSGRKTRIIAAIIGFCGIVGIGCGIYSQNNKHVKNPQAKNIQAASFPKKLPFDSFVRK